MSEIKVNKISPRTACGTTTLGDSGDTFTIPSGVTITNAGTAAGFGSTGEISWDTTPKTGDFTGVSGVGYFVNTAGGAVAVTLPGSPSAGNVVGVSDYNSTSATNAITVNRNSEKINGATDNLSISKANSAVQLVYIDSTTGWQTIFTGNTSDVLNTALVATGGTITTCGNCKIHTFTGPGTFTVTNAASGACAPNNIVSYLVVAGGGGGGRHQAGGGGAGGFREIKSPTTPYTASPLDGYPNAPNRVTVSATAYPITVGNGGASGVGTCEATGSPGGVSTFSTITSAGGGGGGGYKDVPNGDPGDTGGSGGGGSSSSQSGGGMANGGAGNTPSTTPAQGKNGGGGYKPSPHSGGGGGGAGAVGQSITAPGCNGGAGGTGVSTSISGASVARAGGGGGSACAGPAGGVGGSGGGGAGGKATTPLAVAGTVNTGGGGGGGAAGPVQGAAGGSGLVIIRYKFQ